jgi:Uri superfamily endonuclease
MLSFLCLEGEHDDVGRVAGTVRRYIPVDTRDPHGAILHFYVGDAYDSGSKIDDNHILRKLKPKEIWHLTVLGSIATTQREYVALHAFSQLNPQVGFVFSNKYFIYAFSYADAVETHISFRCKMQFSSLAQSSFLITGSRLLQCPIVSLRALLAIYTEALMLLSWQQFTGPQCILQLVRAVG